MRRLLLAALAAGLAIAPAPAVAAPEPLYVMVLWHQHQPQYPKRPGTNVYEQPWVRVHGTKDYYDMAAMVEEFPGLKLTVNLTPVLLRQIDDYTLGATDRHFQLATKDAAQLNAAEKAEAHRRFFQVSEPMLKRFKRFVELKAKPVARYGTQDWRDLQVLFNLAWTDTLFARDAAVAPLLKKGRHFSEAEKLRLLGLHRAIMGRIVPLHKRLQQAGRIEVATTPYYHPILPLIHDTALAKEAMPHAAMPALRLQRPEDARYHVDEAVKYYTRLFGRPPAGMWPGEGSVAQAVAPLFKQAGVKWIATDEEVLGRSLGLALRDGEALSRPDVLYQPYQVANGPAAFFRDRKLSDDIGFRYSKMTGQAAAADMLGQLKAAARAPRKGPRLVSIILDGENAWENYPDDGKAFLRALYAGLTKDPAFKTVTPSEYLARHTPKPLARLWAGSWIGASYATWIGEDEENAAWDMLIRARTAVAEYGRAKGLQHQGYRRAMEKIYAAEGSDWFWWYGLDQDSGRDHEFDAAFRALLTQAYQEIGTTSPTWLAVPIIQTGATPTKTPQGALKPMLDGVLARAEWANAGAIFAQGGAMNIGNAPVGALFYGHDATNLYLGVQFNGETRPLSLAIGALGRPGGVQSPQAGFTAHYELSVDPARDRATLTPFDGGAAISGVVARGGRGSAEIAIPWKALSARSGESLLLRMEVGSQRFPASPLKLGVPLLPLTSLVTLPDGADPGVGPGRYTMPTGPAYTRPSVDMKGLSVGEEGDRWAFTWQLGEVRNPWGSPIGLSLVTLDLYLADAEGQGLPTPLLSGREAFAQRPWARALSIEGWQPALYGPDGQRLADVTVVVDPLASSVRAYVPKALLPGDPTRWSYLSVLAGQDGFAPGRVRQVKATADAERFGGRPGAGWPHLLDALLPAGANQTQVLSPENGRTVLPYTAPPRR